ncbi:probable glutamate receptor, partial [Limulus polyphemus]|uniref:Probable glutamate receptor n=1 Tax=Limulus polyphemus TaxID=6850 RepID=A0ABM1BKP9_LIMPO
MKKEEIESLVVTGKKEGRIDYGDEYINTGSSLCQKEKRSVEDHGHQHPVWMWYLGREREKIDEWIPFVRVEDSESGELTINGPMAIVFRYLARSLHLRYTFKEPSDQTWGSKLPNGSFTGMMGMMQRNEANISVGPTTAGYDRQQVVQFTNTLLVDSYGILTGRPSTSTDSFGYLLALEWKKTTEVFFSGVSKVPVSVSGKLLISVWLVAVVVIMASFGGHLQSSLVIKNKGERIDKLEDVLKFSDVPIFIEGGSASEILLQHSKNKIFKAIWQRIIAQPNSRLPWRDLISDENLDKVESGRLIIIASQLGIIGVLNERFSSGKSCHFHVASETFLSKFMVIAVNKNVPGYMMENLNQRLGHFTQSGIFQKEVEKVTQNATRCIQGLSPQVMLHSQSLNDLKGVFLLW